jgi:acyl-CoA synthetase (AMP-forming)/AMP-acid ligase II
MFHYLLQATRGDLDIRFPNLRLCVSAGAIMPATLNREFEDHLGVLLLDGYGITETSTMVTMNWPDWHTRHGFLRHSDTGACSPHHRSER